MRGRFVWLAGWLALAAAGLAAQSVADVARKSKAESKGQKARVVITDQQLKPSKPAPAKAVGDAGGVSGTGLGEEGVPPGGIPPKSTEEEASDHYRGRFEACLDKLVKQIAEFEQTFAEALKKAQPPPGAPPELHGGYLQRKAEVESYNEQLSKLAAEILQTQREFVELQKKARKAGASRKMMREAEDGFRKLFDHWEKQYLKD
jgi:DNA repair exonuclease SbcCD ATPase subunit